MKIYAIGNCWCWSYIIKCIYGGEIVEVTINEKGQMVTHRMVRLPDKSYLHFRSTFHFLPSKYSYLCFIGEFERIKRKNKKKNNTE